MTTSDAQVRPFETPPQQPAAYHAEGVVFTATSASAPECTAEQLVDTLGHLANHETWNRWVVGDLLLELVARHDGQWGPAVSRYRWGR